MIPYDTARCLHEAMTMALEALESCGAGHISDGGNQWHDEKLVDKAITALRKALAAPVQGWKMVPVEPTREIEDAIAKARTLKASEIWGDAIAAAPQPAQEPVAWMEMVVANLVREGVNKHKARELAQHFYTSSPAQRPWVGLTWQDWNGVAYTSDFRRGAEWADAQLREKK